MTPGSLVRIRAESLDPNFPDVATLVLYTKAGILIPPATHFQYTDVGLVLECDVYVDEDDETYERWLRISCPTGIGWIREEDVQTVEWMR
jgi:hypothetical protein